MANLNYSLVDQADAPIAKASSAKQQEYDAFLAAVKDAPAGKVAKVSYSDKKDYWRTRNNIIKAAKRAALELNLSKDDKALFVSIKLEKSAAEPKAEKAAKPKAAKKSSKKEEQAAPESSTLTKDLEAMQ